jgi:Family of unknown function (DUF5677)
VTRELDVQKECQKELVSLVNRLKRVITDQANEIKNRELNVTERSLILSSSVSKLNELARVILQIRSIDAIDEMHVLLRSTLELVVNACYLQHARDEEIWKYLHFDPINNHTAMTDLERASGGRLRIPKELAERTTKLATDASAASNLALGSRDWSKKNLFKRAVSVDKAVGGDDFAMLMANIYVIGSGYVHTTYKILGRHSKWLLHGEEEHPLRILFGTNNAIHGVALVLINLGRYFNRKFDTAGQPFNEAARLAEHLANAANKDHSNHRKRQEANVKSL